MLRRSFALESCRIVIVKIGLAIVEYSRECPEALPKYRIVMREVGEN